MQKHITTLNLSAISDVISLRWIFGKSLGYLVSGYAELAVAVSLDLIEHKTSFPGFFESFKIKQKVLLDNWVIFLRLVS